MVKDNENEGSVFPWGGIIGPVIGGVILILVGLSSLFGWAIWEDFWEVFVIIIGLLIIIAAIYNTRRRN